MGRILYKIGAIAGIILAVMVLLNSIMLQLIGYSLILYFFYMFMYLLLYLFVLLCFCILGYKTRNTFILVSSIILMFALFLTLPAGLISFYLYFISYLLLYIVPLCELVFSISLLKLKLGSIPAIMLIIAAVYCLSDIFLVIMPYFSVYLYGYLSFIYTILLALLHAAFLALMSVILFKAAKEY